MHSVIGIANQMASAPAATGKIKMSAPLITIPLATDTRNDVLGCIIA